MGWFKCWEMEEAWATKRPSLSPPETQSRAFLHKDRASSSASYIHHQRIPGCNWAIPVQLVIQDALVLKGVGVKLRTPAFSRAHLNSPRSQRSFDCVVKRRNSAVPRHLEARTNPWHDFQPGFKVPQPSSLQETTWTDLAIYLARQTAGRSVHGPSHTLDYFHFASACSLDCVSCFAWQSSRFNTDRSVMKEHTNNRGVRGSCIIFPPNFKYHLLPWNFFFGGNKLYREKASIVPTR